jgi:radical SAM superfamily enzyme YgiQ (UPF0313 family)
MKKKVYSADLTHTGNGTMALTFPLGTAYVVSYAKKMLGDSFSFKLFKYQDKLSNQILKDPPDILALSNYCWNIELGYTLINWAKKINPKLIVILGGPNFPTEAEEKKKFFKQRPFVDFYIESEGEIGFVKILEKLQKYDFNTKVLKNSEEHIVNCCYLNEENLIQAQIERIKDVNILPSPYLDGTMDEFFDLPLIPMLETTRGCPFSCTFCADGLSFKNKIYSYDMQRVKDEIKYVCDRVKNMDELRFSDLNFGMYKQDVETSEYIATLQRDFGWPKLIRASLGKNRPDRIIEIAKILKGSLIMGSAQQSSDENVLTNIKRKNITGKTYNDLLKFMHKTNRKAKTFTEFILGVPGDSKRTHFNSLKYGVDNGVNTIRMFQAILLSGTEMANRATREKFKLLTKYRVLTGAVGRYQFAEENIPVTEIEEIIVGSKDMSFEDYVSCRRMDLLIETFHNNALFEEFFLSLKKLGISEWDCLVYIYEHEELYTSKMKEIMKSYIKATKNGLYDSYEQAKTKSVSHGRFEKHLSGEIGSLELVEHKGKLYHQLESLVEILLKVSKIFMKRHEILTETNIDYFEQLGRYILCAKSNIINPEIEHIEKFNYDWVSIDKMNFDVVPSEIKRSDKEIPFRFFHDMEQKKQIKNALALHPNNLTGAPLIYNQNLKILYRNFDLCAI